MPQPLPQHYVLNRVFADADDLATEARQWSLDFQQLTRGKFHGDVLQFGVSNVHISEARFGQSLYQKGTPPSGMRTIAVPASPDLRLQWRGKWIDGQSLMVFPLGAELSSVSGPDFHVYTCSFPEAALSSIGEHLEVGDVEAACRGEDAIRVRPAAIRKLRSVLRRICNSVRRDSQSLHNAGLIRQLTCDLPREMMATIGHRQEACSFVAQPRRRAVLARAESYIKRHAASNISVADISQAARVSERTLEYAFAQRYGMGPKQFVNALRLISVRRDLRAADPRKTKVADVANAWGFWHMGQFAADYRTRFDELPSETLQRQLPA